MSSAGAGSRDEKEEKWIKGMAEKIIREGFDEVEHHGVTQCIFHVKPNVSNKFLKNLSEVVCVGDVSYFFPLNTALCFNF